MSRINNAQRSAFARILAAERRKIEQEWQPTLSLNRFSNFTTEKEPTLIAVIKKHRLIRYKRAAVLAEAELDEALKAATRELENANEKQRGERTARLEAITRAISDVWASEHIETATAIVTRFVHA